MLDAFIIEEIKRREEAQRREEARRPRLEIPKPLPPVQPRGEPDEVQRGVVVIDYY